MSGELAYLQKVLEEFLAALDGNTQAEVHLIWAKPCLQEQDSVDLEALLVREDACPVMIACEPPELVDSPRDHQEEYSGHLRVWRVGTSFALLP